MPPRVGHPRQSTSCWMVLRKGVEIRIQMNEIRLGMPAATLQGPLHEAICVEDGEGTDWQPRYVQGPRGRKIALHGHGEDGQGVWKEERGQ